MSLGSFLADVGAGIEDIDVYRTERELRGLQRDAAASQRAALQRAEELRRSRASLRALGEQFTDVSGLVAPPEAGAAGLLPNITPPPAPAPTPAQAGLDVPTGDETPTFDIQALRDLEAEVTRPGAKGRGAAAPSYTRRTVKFAGVDVPGIVERSRPDRLNDGIGRFQRVDPNASDADQAFLARRNADLLRAELSAMAGKAGYALADWRMSTATQAEKKEMQRGEKAAAWYRSDMANRYFRQNPELVAVAKGDPVKFYETVQRAGVASRNAPKAPAQAGGSAPSAAGVAPPVVAKPAQARLQAINEAIASIPANDPFRRIIGLEGGFNTRNGTFKTSPAGAVGPAQLMPGTAPEAMELAGFSRNDKRWKTDPQINIMAGRAYYNMLLNRFGGDATKAAAAYNAGAGRVDAAVRKAERSGLSWVDHMPAKETRDYVRDFLSDSGRATRFTGGTAPQQAGLSQPSVAQEPPLNLTNLNSYLGDPTKIGFTASNEIRKREILRQEAILVSQYGTEEEYQQIAARVQETDANLLRLMGAQAIIEVNNFNNPARAQQLLSLMSGGQLQVRMREDGRFAFLARNQQGEFVPVPGQENVSRSQFLRTLREASDEVYRTQMEQAEAQIAALQVKGQQEADLEILKGRIQGEIKQYEGQVDIAQSIIAAKAKLAEASAKGAEVKPFTDENGTWITRTNPNDSSDPILARVVNTTLPTGEVIQTLDQRPFSQWGGSAQ